MCRIGLFNKDDEHYEDMIDGATCKQFTFSLNEDSVNSVWNKQSNNYKMSIYQQKTSFR